MLFSTKKIVMKVIMKIHRLVHVKVVLKAIAHSSTCIQPITLICTFLTSRHFLYDFVFLPSIYHGFSPWCVKIESKLQLVVSFKVTVSSVGTWKFKMDVGKTDSISL